MAWKLLWQWMERRSEDRAAEGVRRHQGIREDDQVQRFLTDSRETARRWNMPKAGGLIAGCVALLLASGCSAPSADKAAADAKPTAHGAGREPAGGAPKHLRILTEDQYLNSLAYVFGPDIRPVATFPPPQRTDGLIALGASRSGVTSQQLELYQKAALTVAGLVVNPEHRIFLIGCKPASETAADKACATEFLREKGRLLNHRPLTPEELAMFVDLANKSADTLKNFYTGLGDALEAMLVSPDVLFVRETSEPDPKNPGEQRLDSYSLATRLSLFLWNALPDDALLKAAESGELRTKKGMARQVDRMLASARLETGMRAFFDDMFGFDDFNALSKDAAIYPHFTGQTMVDAREETIRTVIDHLITQKKDYRDLFTTRETFVSPALAVIYGLATGPNWVRYQFPTDIPRAGILTQVSFLAVHSHPGRSSATLRGKALRELLLCQPVPMPPPNVDFSAVENPDPKLRTARDRLEVHRKNPVCAGCHKITDPMGLALENFDGAGRYRTSERGAKIDASGALDGNAFEDVAGLGKAVHDHPALTSCLVKRVYSYGTGGPTSSSDSDLLAYFNARFAEQGYRLAPLLRTIALSDAFVHVSEDPAPAAEHTAVARSGAAAATTSK
jgi:hypothetical protein